MKLKSKILVLIIIIYPTVISTNFLSNIALANFSQNNNLTIYRYEGFMGWGDESSQVLNKSAIDNSVFYDWGLENGFNVTIIDTDDANSLLTLLKSEKENPKADVVIGLDNALLALAKNEGYAEDILARYEPVNSSLIRQDLIQQLDSNFLLTPIDFGALAFYYDSNIINTSIVPNLNNLTINDLLTPSIAQQLIFEDALSSSPGTGFLLWSIASHKLENRLDDWKSFWNAIKADVLITPSWTEGFDALYSPEVNRSILMSYATSPAYDRCVYDYSGTKTFFTKENGTTNSWLQIEGIGLIKNAPNPEGGKKFIDWMVSTEVQKLIPITNWMYPANTEAQSQLPDCFNEGAINPDLLFILNTVLPISEVQANLAIWLNDWDLLIAGETAPGFSIELFIYLILMSILIRKRKLIKK